MAGKKRVQSDEGGEVEVPMTPMIDVVFMLLIFFLLTFKIVVPEGDFSIRMPIAPPSESNVDIEEEVLTMVVGLRADGNGNLRRITVGEKVLWPKGGASVAAARPMDADTGYQLLRSEMLDNALDSSGQVDPVAAQSIEVDIDADPELKFQFVIEAMTRVCGYTTGSVDDPVIHRLVSKVRLKPPKRAF